MKFVYVIKKEVVLLILAMKPEYLEIWLPICRASFWMLDTLIFLLCTQIALLSLLFLPSSFFRYTYLEHQLQAVHRYSLLDHTDTHINLLVTHTFCHLIDI